MFTRCPSCETVYRVSSKELSSARGRVRCGRCDAIFDALARLSDDPLKPRRPLTEATAEPPVEATADVEDVREAKRPPPRPAAAPAWMATAAMRRPPPRRPETEEIANQVRRRQTEIQVGEEAQTRPPVVHMPAARAPSWFATMPTGEAPAPAASEQDTAADRSEAQTRPPAINMPAARAPSWFTTVPTGEAPAPAESEQDTAADRSDAAPDTTAPASESPARDTPGPAAQTAIPTRSSAEVEALLRELGPEKRRPRRRGLRWLLVVAAVAVLAVSLVHSKRGVLMRDPELEILLGGWYQRLGIPVSPAWDPRRFTIQVSAADEDGRGRLIVTTVFRNDADFEQPYPILRVTLEDRWGEPVGDYDFQPADYVRAYVAGRRLRTGERVNAEVVIPSPGLDALGFNIDLCLDTGQPVLSCAMD